MNGYFVISLAIMVMLLCACASTDTQQISEEQEVKNNVKQSHIEQTKTKKVDVQKALRHAQNFRDDKNNEKALSVLEPIADDPEIEKTEYFWIELALNYIDIKKPEKAETSAKQAVKSNPESAYALYILGLSLEEQEKFEKAERAYHKSIDVLDRRDPRISKADILNAIALTKAAQEDFDAAAKILLDAKETFPNDKNIERNLRIMTALQQSYGKPVPKPSQKPKIEKTDRDNGKKTEEKEQEEKDQEQNDKKERLTLNH